MMTTSPTSLLPIPPSQSLSTTIITTVIITPSLHLSLSFTNQNINTKNHTIIIIISCEEAQTLLKMKYKK
ncbi:hypothetical protein HanRHA438_Chr16g0742901 [Helianthus annuus]|nr:hypothetical protein HanRHA438_Chr16g0742901 [Helianthus annuus]